MSSDYEQLRLRNIEDNKRVLAELGLLNPFLPLPKVTKKAPKRKRQLTPVRQEKKYIINTGSLTESPGSWNREGRRKSTRLQGKEAVEGEALADECTREIEDEEKEDEGRLQKPPSNRPMVYGAIPGVEVGTLWQTRIEVNYVGIHRPTVAGIHGGPEGAYSLALSGGYEDDIDLGECFTYTGEGGRDLKGTSIKPKNLRTAPQSRDQCLSKGNAGLIRSTETNLPVRVLRGYKLRGPFAPEEGYRYDGLYKVEKWWFTTGMAGHGVYKFALKRLEDQAPPPWSMDDKPCEDNNNDPTETDSGVGSKLPSRVTSDAESDTESTTKSPAAETGTNNSVKPESPEPETASNVKLPAAKSNTDSITKSPAAETDTNNSSVKPPPLELDTDNSVKPSSPEPETASNVKLPTAESNTDCTAKLPLTESDTQDKTGVNDSETTESLSKPEGKECQQLEANTQDMSTDDSDQAEKLVVEKENMGTNRSEMTENPKDEEEKSEPEMRDSGTKRDDAEKLEKSQKGSEDVKSENEFEEIGVCSEEPVVVKESVAAAGEKQEEENSGTESQECDVNSADESHHKSSSEKCADSLHDHSNPIGQAEVAEPQDPEGRQEVEMEMSDAKNV